MAAELAAAAADDVVELSEDPPPYCARATGSNERRIVEVCILI